VTALGGKPTDPGGPIIHEANMEGRIPNKDGLVPTRLICVFSSTSRRVRALGARLFAACCRNRQR
jgi:hypothetical protein